MKDPRERHFVCKLDRYQLEDKYLRLLEEIQCLKKLSNSQEDKIKRLVTKLMRVSANPRACINLHDICNDKERISQLECENSKLKNKVNVLRNQLLSHVTQGRLSSRRRKVTGIPSGATTCRSENMGPKTPSCHCLMQNGPDDCELQKYLLKIQELEAEKREMASRISELESELANMMTGNQREKIAENIEHIRARRQIKECTEKLDVFEKENDSLKEQVACLKKLLAEATMNNKEITSFLMVERKKMAEMDEQMIKAKDSKLSLREKDEQIRDLMNEMKILQQHNSELIALSSKYAQIEVENVELKKKISEKISDHQILKNALNNEQANINALQSANSQLLAKLHELQMNIDTLTIQLMAFQGKPEKQERIPKDFFKDQKQKYLERRISSSSTGSSMSEHSCADLANTCEKICDVVKQKPEKNLGVEKESQTEGSYLKETSRLPGKKEIVEEPKIDCARKEVPERRKSQDMNGHVKTVQNGSPLSRERMLKLLEQAQINTPFETQSARLRQIKTGSESVQKQRQVMSLEALLFGDSSCF